MKNLQLDDQREQLYDRLEGASVGADRGVRQNGPSERLSMKRMQLKACALRSRTATKSDLPGDFAMKTGLGDKTSGNVDEWIPRWVTPADYIFPEPCRP